MYSLKILLEAMKGQWVSMLASKRVGRLSSMMISKTSSDFEERYDPYGIQM